jgi:hypothetical protein
MVRPLPLKGHVQPSGPFPAEPGGPARGRGLPDSGGAGAGGGRPMPAYGAGAPESC